MYVLVALIGIGFIIFLHELGHYLAARRVGVRVERFSLGFDPKVFGRNLRIFSFRKGPTEYVLGIIPFGGYVKLAGGEGPLEPGHTPASDELPGKPVGARAFVFAAGAAMNIASALVFFMIAFKLGVDFTEPRVGVVEPGSPAWNLGIHPGDKVLEIDGKPTNDHMELVLASALGGGRSPLHLKLERPAPAAGEPPQSFELDLSARWSESLGLYTTGIDVRPGPAVDLVLKEPPDGSSAASAGIRAGDQIVGVERAGVEFPRLNSAQLVNVLFTILEMHPADPVRLRLKRGDTETWVTLQRKLAADAAPSAILQILAGDASVGGTFIRAVAPGSSAQTLLRAGEQLVALGGDPVVTAHWLALMPRLKGPTIRLTLRSLDGQIRDTDAPSEDLLLWLLRQEIHWGDPQATVARFEPSSPLAAAGLKPHDTIVSVDGTALFDPEELTRLIQSGHGETVDLRVLRGDAIISVRAPRQPLGRDAGAVWRTFPRLALVTPGGPAAAAGITAGSRITKLGSDEILSFAQLLDSLKSAEAGSTVQVEWIDFAGASKAASVKLGAIRTTGYTPVGLVLHEPRSVVRTDLLGACVMGFERTVLVGKHVFLMLRGLARREVSAKNLSGPVGITHVFTIMAERGFVHLIYIMAMVSVNLGLVNLLPFPILDGGHLVFLLVEKLKGSPVNAKIQEWAMLAAFLVIISFALFVTFHDISRLFR